MNVASDRLVMKPDEKDWSELTFRAYSFTDALLNNSDVQDFYNTFSPNFYKYLAENAKRCVIHTGHSTKRLNLLKFVLISHDGWHRM